MRPYPAARIGPMAARQASHVPTTLTSRQARSCAVESWSMVPRACTPALVTSTSSRPYRDSTRCRQAGDVILIGDVARVAQHGTARLGGKALSRVRASAG